MSSTQVVPVFHLDQDWSWMQPSSFVSREEARRLKTCGSHFFVNHGRALCSKEAAPPPLLSLPPGPIETACTITFSEIQANVGITSGGDPGAPADRNLVMQAQHKIRAYPHVFDELAVRARGFWAQSPLSIVVAS